MVGFRALAFSTVLVVFSAGAALADCAALPAFAPDLDPTTVPDPPVDVASRGDVEKYRLSLENFRKKVIEGYNDAIVDYLASLNRIDARARQKAADGDCTVDEYNDLRDKLSDEYAKSGSDYLHKYWNGLSVYKQDIGWCVKEDQDIVDSQKTGA